MRTGTRRTAGTAALLAGLVLPLAGCGLSFQSLPKVSSPVGPHYTLKATFQEVLNLPADAQVRMGPQVVGQVGGITTKDFVARVDINVKNGIALPAGTTAQVRFDNPLGDQYVALTPPQSAGGAPMKDGDSLDQSSTSSAASVEDALGALSTVLNGGGINQLQTIVHELNNTFDGNQQQIHDLLGQIDTAVSSLADGRTAVTDAIAAINALGTQLNAGAPTLTAGIDQLAPAIGVLASQNGEISNLLQNVDQLSVVANRLLAESGQNSVTGLKTLLPVVNQLVDVKERIGSDLQSLATLSKAVADKAPGGYLQVGLQLDVTLPPGPSTPLAAANAAPAGTSAAAVQSLLQGGLR